MTALRTPFRARLLVEHLEDRSQPAAVSMTPLAGAVILDPVDQLTPAIAGDRVAGISNAAATSPAAVSEPTLFILFGPDDEAEFAVLVEPAQAPPLPAETALSIAALEQQVGLRVVFVAVDFPGNNDLNFFTHHGRFVDQINSGSNPPEGQATLPPPLPNHPSLGSDLDPLLIPAGAVNAVNRAEAPMPRAVEGQAVAPPVERDFDRDASRCQRGRATGGCPSGPVRRGRATGISGSFVGILRSVCRGDFRGRLLDASSFGGRPGREAPDG
jgi:hypothetical protein